MHRYIARRLVFSSLVLVLVTLLIFSLVHVLPGDVVMLMLGERGNLPAQELARFREQLGLDKPFWIQYGLWVWGILRLDWGDSLWSPSSVWSQIGRAAPVSVELAIMSILLALVIGIPVGVVAAVRRNTLLDYVSRSVSLLGLSMPAFFVGTLLVLLLSVQFRWLPPLSYVAPWENPRENLLTFLFPSLILALALSASIARITRSSLLEVVREDYIRTARAKGLREQVVFFRHAMKNAMIPVVTLTGTLMNRLMSGAVIVEVLFSLPGLGRLTLDSILIRDYPQIQGNLLLFALLVLAINLLTDLSYAWMDPRIRYS
ncbi:MAG: ABC transporter permease [Chloroflexi bacterium]|nr:ABC transporter permease [Chloroflexota bacterium]